MKYTGIAAFALMIACAIAASPAEESTAPTPPQVLAQFLDSLRAGDVDRAVALTAPLKGVPAEAVREEYKELADYMKSGAVLDLVAHLKLADTAVVVYREGGPGKSSTIDLDPAYLQRRSGKWFVLFELTEFDKPHFDIDEESLRNFKKLQAWFNEQQPLLAKLLRDG